MTIMFWPLSSPSSNSVLIKIHQKRPIQAFSFPHIPLILRQFFDSLDLM